VFPLADRDPLGRAGRIELAGGGLIEAAWDGNGRVTDWYVESGTGASEARAYDYDDRGRLASQSVTTSVGTREDTFGYQEPGWLTTETVDVYGVFGLPETRVYDQDAAGNRTQRTVDGVGEAVHTYAYGNQLTDVGAASVTWDGLGGITEDHRGYTFDRNADGSEGAITDPTGAQAHVIRIDPRVDVVFQHLFGDPKREGVRLRFLNDVLAPAVPITRAEVRNPFNLLKFEGD
jgi:hypothetical protein